MGQTASVPASSFSPAPAARDKAATGGRLQNIDALRGFVMVIMLLDHLRETWFVYVPVTDPVDARTILPALAFARLAASLCAPIFVALTGLGVFLFHSKHTVQETTSFLLKRGLLLMAIEVCILSPLYWSLSPLTFWLQVIWCIGVSMIVLAGLIRLPHKAIIAVGLLIVFGHNLLDPIQFKVGDSLLPLWAEVHQRASFPLLGGAITIKTTYPILPWIGVISLGFGIGPWFLPHVAPATRQRRLVLLGLAMIAGFVILRLLNIYGDKPWFVVEGSALRTFISFISMTKYPPSLLFLLPTLGIGALLLVLFERVQGGLTNALSIFGGAPMFFYIFHLCVLRILYHSALAIWGPNHEGTFGVDNYGWVLVWYIGLIVPLYFPTAWFSQLKKRRRDIGWLKYF